MKRLNPQTGKEFKYGDLREDGFVFHKYNLSAKVKKDGFYQENWLSPKTFEAEKEKAAKRNAAYHAKHKEKRNKNSAEWRRNNLEYSKKLVRDWFAKNRPKRATYQAKRRANTLQATPKWLTPAQHKQILDTYAIAKTMTEITGEQHSVDHVVPLKHKKVCGLHVPWNLHVITTQKNIEKSNKFEV